MLFSKVTVHTSPDVQHEKHKYNGCPSYYRTQSNAAQLSVSNLLVMGKKVASNSIYMVPSLVFLSFFVIKQHQYREKRTSSGFLLCYSLLFSKIPVCENMFYVTAAALGM